MAREWWIQRGWVFGLVSLLATSCDGGGATLVVDLKTDYVPGYQFAGVRTEVGDPELTGVTARDESLVVSGADYLQGARVAELSNLTAGEVAVQVTLVDGAGAPVATRTTLLHVSGQHALTVLMTSACEGVSCPQDDPAASACVGGRCVDPRCSPEAPEWCGEPGCTSDAGCSDGPECAEGVCLSGECFLRADDARCDPAEICAPQVGCVQRSGADAGPPCATTESACNDGLDGDCDGAVDCADSDCLATPCDDGSICTDGDVCRADGRCGGTPIDCDDANACTDDGCDPTGGCVHTNNTASCDDGTWCNGADSCRDGLCQVHSDPPCAELCNEATMACDMCATDADCGSVTVGSWSGCGGFDGTCDETGSETRSVMTPRCDAGACVVDAELESRGCSRTVGDGTICGTDRACCSGTCTSLSSPTSCGACGVNCAAQGLTQCARTPAILGAPGTGFACVCSGPTTPPCRAAYDASATCWNGDGRTAWFCQCQCPCSNCTCDGGCGPGFGCRDEYGHNYCAPG